jgi:hypothetical protein
MLKYPATNCLRYLLQNSRTHWHQSLMVLLEAAKRVDEKSIIPGPSHLMECDSLDSFLFNHSIPWIWKLKIWSYALHFGSSGTSSIPFLL